MRKTLTFATAFLVAASITPALHAASKPKKAPPKEEATPASQLSPEQQASYRRSAQILRAFNVAFESQEVQPAVKGRLLSCLYNNKLQAISDAAGEVIANNSALSADKPGDIYRAAAGVCGITFKKEGADGDAPSKPSGEEGR